MRPKACQRLSTASQKGGAIRRFDRKDDGTRVHIEDFAQVFDAYPEDKYRKGRYRSIARVLWLEVGEVAVREFIARLVSTPLSAMLICT